MVYSKTTWVDDSAPALSAANLNKVETGVEEAHGSADAPRTLVWNGSQWWDTVAGAVAVARPSVPAWPAGWVLWDTHNDVTFDTPPPLASTDDEWEPHDDLDLT